MNSAIREKYFREHERLQDAITKEAMRVINIVKKSLGEQSMDKMLNNGFTLDETYIEHDDEQVVFKLEEDGCSCCPSEYQYLAVPFSIMFDEYELNEHIEKLKQRKIELEAKKEEENRIAQQKSLDYKRELYERLKRELGE